VRVFAVVSSDEVAASDAAQLFNLRSRAQVAIFAVESGLMTRDRG